MKNVKTTVQDAKVEKLNSEKDAFAAWLKEVEVKQAALEAEKEAKRSQRKTTTINFSPSANVILEIRNASVKNPNKGLTVAEIMQIKPKSYFRKNKMTGELEEQDFFSIDSVKRDWNVNKEPLQYANKRLIKNGVNVGFKIEEAEPNPKILKAAHNNRIILPEMFIPTIDQWLKQQTNFNEDWLVQ